MVGRRLCAAPDSHPQVRAQVARRREGTEEQPTALGRFDSRGGGGSTRDPARRGTRFLQRRWQQAGAGAVPRDSLGGAARCWSSTDQVARAATLIRLDPRVRWDAALRAARAAWALVGEDDRALRTPRRRTEHGVLAPALRCIADRGGNAFKWAPGGPEHPP